MTEINKYIPKDPQVKKAFQIANLIFIPVLLVAAGLIYMILPSQPETTAQTAISIVIAIIIALLMAWWCFVSWFDHWLPVVKDPDQFYERVIVLPGYAKIFNAYKRWHPEVTHLSAADFPAYMTPIEIRSSRLIPIFIFALSMLAFVVTSDFFIKDYLDLPDGEGHISSFILAYIFCLAGLIFGGLGYYFRGIMLSFTDEGIIMDKTIYDWKQIVKYEIIDKGEGKSTVNYLTLTLKSGHVYDLCIDNLELSASKIDDIVNSFMARINT